jgi:hypothetical protein
LLFKRIDLLTQISGLRADLGQLGAEAVNILSSRRQSLN